MVSAGFYNRIYLILAGQLDKNILQSGRVPVQSAYWPAVLSGKLGDALTCVGAVID